MTTEARAAIVAVAVTAAIYVVLDATAAAIVASGLCVGLYIVLGAIAHTRHKTATVGVDGVIALALIISIAMLALALGIGHPEYHDIVKVAVWAIRGVLLVTAAFLLPLFLREPAVS